MAVPHPREATLVAYSATWQTNPNPPNEHLHKEGIAMTKQSDNDNHSNQLNPNNDEYWHSRGYDDRPDDWEEKASDDDSD